MFLGSFLHMLQNKSKKKDKKQIVYNMTGEAALGECLIIFDSSGNSNK